MTITHHPDDALLTAFAAGTLDLGQHVAIATHLASCPHCRSFVQAMEQVGGSVLDSLPPSTMASNALARVEARLSNRPAAEEAKADAATRPATDPDTSGLPKFVQRYQLGRWQWIAPRVHLRPIALPVPSETRVFLLRSGPRTRMLEHSHTGIEMTCVLKGAFRHDGGHFGPGDFDLGDENVEHRPIVDATEDCVCLVAMVGDLRLNGLIGRLMQPFVRL
jgi:putative transcriptional regulator